MLVVGIGTGRCGSVSLARLLGKQRGVKFTHESRPLLPWRREDATEFDIGILDAAFGITDPMEPYRVHAERFRERLDDYQVVGDVASPWLQYLPELLSEFPDARVIALIRRDKERFIESFMKKAGERADHWCRGKRKDRWSIIFPEYPVDDNREALDMYWEDYNARIWEWKEELREQMLVVFTKDLSDFAAQDRIFGFVGLDRHYHDPAWYNAGPFNHIEARPVQEDQHGRPL